MRSEANAKKRRRRLRGNQTPRIRVCPDYAYTYGHDAAELASAYGLTPDPWQELILCDWLGRDEYGKYAAQTCGLSVPRQNGKNGVLEARELYGMTIDGERILHTAHEVKTARKAFDRLVSFFEDEVNYPELVAMVKTIRKTNGQEAILLANGGSIEFSARSRGASRGFTVDVVICDEAQELTDEQLEALMPTKSAGPLQNSQLILLGTPPNHNAVGDVFKRTRDKAISGKSDIACWIEWSVEEIGDIYDESRWEDANPALGYRLTREAIEAELASMSEDGFARERLGWWREGAVNALFSIKRWDSLKTATPPPDGKLAYAARFSVDGSTVALAAAVKPKTGNPYVEVIEHRSMAQGSTWLIDWIEGRWRKAAIVVIDGKAGAQATVDELRRRGVGKASLLLPKADEVVAAASMLLNDVREGTVSHYGQPALDDAIEHAVRRPIGTGGGFGFKSSSEDSDITPAEAASLALWGVKTTKRDPSRKQVIL